MKSRAPPMTSERVSHSNSNEFEIFFKDSTEVKENQIRSLQIWIRVAFVRCLVKKKTNACSYTDSSETELLWFFLEFQRHWIIWTSGI